jgi:hypothetical protein
VSLSTLFLFYCLFQIETEKKAIEAAKITTRANARITNNMALPFL